MFTEYKTNKSSTAGSVLKKTRKFTKIFFNSLGGKMMYSRFIKVPTYSSGNFKIPCVNYYIEFSNDNLFGKGDLSKEVYPRFRKLRTDWKSYLKHQDIKLYKDLAIGFIPLLNENPVKGFAYKKDVKKPVGVKILAVNNDSPDYYKKMVEEFGIRFMLEEDKGMLIGPESGMMCVLKAISQVRDIYDFIDIGAGTGELSAYVLKNCHPRRIIVNELSLRLKTHLKRYLQPLSLISGTKLIFNFESCIKINIPAGIDLISVGVFYGDQPSFIRLQGLNIATSLGKEGLLLMQSSMPETLFSQHILLGDLDGLKKWPWYSDKFVISKYFSCVVSFFIDNQFITLASQSHKVINEVLENLQSKIIRYDDFQSKNKINYYFDI